jgi:hypothetical protein
MEGKEQRGFIFAPTTTTTTSGGGSEKKKYRDVFLKTSCDTGVASLARLMNAHDAFNTLVTNGMKPRTETATTAATVSATAAPTSVASNVSSTTSTSSTVPATGTSTSSSAL